MSAPRSRPTHPAPSAAGLPAALLVAALLGLASVSRAEGDPFFEAPVTLRHAHVLDRMGARLDALDAWAAAAETGEAHAAAADDAAAATDDAVSEEEAGGPALALAAPLVAEDLPRLAGTLGGRSPATLEALERALQAVADAAASDGAILDAVPGARAALDAAREPLLGGAPLTAPDLLAARIALLLIAEGGVSDGYEEAAHGDTEGFTLAWAERRRAEALWVALADASAGKRREVDAAFGDLARLISTPLPAAPLGGDPEDAEEPAQRAVGALERYTGARLYPDRELPRLASLAAETAAEGCAAAERAPALAVERLLASADAYTPLADTAGLFAPEAAAALDGAFAALEPGMGAAELERVCGEALPALDAVRTAVGG